MCSTAEKFKKQTKSDQVHFLKLDLASLESIREFTTAFKAKFNRIDILINNAGIEVLFNFITIS
jgi:NAD(P)-dependent dehydrogenase (short-subunit alcohol dehydrogenase family)